MIVAFPEVALIKGLEDIKKVITIRISKDRQINGQKKKGGKKEKQPSTKTLHKQQMIEKTRTPLKVGDELRCSGRVSSSYNTSGTRLFSVDTNPVISF